MADVNPTEAALLPHIIKFSEILSECLPYAWEARRYLYATLFVRVSQKKKDMQVVDEFEEVWNSNPIGLYELLPGLVNMFGDPRDPDWSWVRSQILSFYSKYNDKDGVAGSSSTSKIPESFRPLPSIYHSVRKDIQSFQESKDERLKVAQTLQNELKEFVKRNPGSQCPVARRYVTIRKTAEPDVVWNVKEDAFMQIFQRTRELFHFQKEEIHFHHAASIIEFWDEGLRRKHKPDSRNDEVAFEKQAKDLKTLQRVYVEVLENSQKKLQMDEVVKYVTDKMKLSRKFISIRNAASRDFEKGKKLLGESINGESKYVLPALVDRKASLASALYNVLHERRKTYDELAHVTDKITKQLQQIHGWEEMTGTSMLSVIPSQPTEAPPEQGSDQYQELLWPEDPNP